MREPTSLPVRLPLPARSASAPGGRQVLNETMGRDLALRHDAVVDQILQGNVPDPLRDLVPVDLSSAVVKVTVWVTADVVAVGGGADVVRVPLGGPQALRLARSLRCWLPTRKIVDAIYAQSALQLTPQPMEPTAQMTSNAYFMEHHRRIEEQLAVTAPRADTAPSTARLLAGHKKDLVLTPRLLERQSRVAIYGWHQPDGVPIQPLSTVHGAQYADYSHGVRLVWEEVMIDGQQLRFVDVLRDPNLAGLLSDEGDFDVQEVARAVLQD